MPNTPISGFTSGAPAQSGDEFVVARSGANFKLASSDIKTLIIGAGSVSIASGKTFTASNTLTLAGTDSTTMTFPSTSATIARTDAGNTFTGAQTFSVGTVNGTGLDISQTWTGTGTYTGLKYNVGTDSGPSNAASLLLDLQVGGASAVKVRKDGYIFMYGNGATGNGNFIGPYKFGTQEVLYVGPNFVSNGGLQSGFMDSRALLMWNANQQVSYAPDLFLSRGGTATLQLGAADAAAPVAQFFKVQGVVAGTTNTAGANFTIQGSQGTGTGAGGSIIFQVAPAGSSGTAQNAYSTALTLNSAQQAVFAVGSASSTSLTWGAVNTGWYSRGNNWAHAVGGTQIMEISGGGTASVSIISPSALSFGLNPASFPPDVFLYRDAANTLALRNGTNAQLFRVYSTYNGTNDAYGAIGAGVKLDGTYASGDENILYIGSQKKGSPTALTKLAIQVDGTTRIDYGVTNGSSLTLTASQVVINECNIRLGDTRFMFWQNRTVLASPADGQLTLWNNAGSDFGRLNFGGTTSSFPALKRSTTTLQVRLADDTAFASFQTGGFSGGAPTIKTANYTQLEADYSLIFNGSGSITLTLLAASTYPGKILYVKTIAAQTVVSASSNVKPIDTDTAGTAILAATAGKWAMLQSDGTNWVIMAQG